MKTRVDYKAEDYIMVNDTFRWFQVWFESNHNRWVIQVFNYNGDYYGAEYVR